jgi:hypothetical protein
MSAEKMSCRDCGLCNVEEEECTLTGRKITLDSLRNCKKGFRKELLKEKGE